MKSKLLSILAGAALVLIVAPSVAADEARVLSVEGLAQYRTVSGGTWVDVVDGARIPEGSEISTGIGARVLLDVQGSTVTVQPLSRLTVSAMETDSETTRSYIGMRYGRLAADVRRSSGRGTDFRVFTPISTAAVRGTEFLYDGYTLEVLHGDVSLQNTANQHHSVREGQVSRAYQGDAIESVEATILEDRYF